MKLPEPKDMDARIDAIFGPGFAAALQKAAQAIDRNRLRELSPLPWDTTQFPVAEYAREQSPQEPIQNYADRRGI